MMRSCSGGISKTVRIMRVVSGAGFDVLGRLGENEYSACGCALCGGPPTAYLTNRRIRGMVLVSVESPPVAL